MKEIIASIYINDFTSKKKIVKVDKYDGIIIIYTA